MSASVWKCDECGNEGVWADGWQWYGSYRDQDDYGIFLTFCSNKCARAKPEKALEKEIAKRIRKAYPHAKKEKEPIPVPFTTICQHCGKETTVKEKPE